VGSGWVGARRAFFTAGHCVYHPKFGGWVTWAAIAPRYNNNVVPTYTVASVYALKGWLDSSKREFDMAACVVTVSFATTEPPLAFDAGILPGLNFTAIGYPAKPVPGYDFNGKRMWKCVGDFIRTKKNRLYAANNFTSGGSGGPWCETGRLGVVSGLNAARHTDPQIAISPYFASGFQKLYDAVKDF
jgi:V8-like Glu-specific endopeptidase